MKMNPRTRNQQLADAFNRNKLRTLAPNLLPGIKAEDLVDIICEECEGTEFSPCHTLKSASSIQTANGQPTLVQFPLGFKCNKCGALNKIIPANLYKKKEGQA